MLEIIFSFRDHNFCKNLNVEVSDCKHWAEGGAGTVDLAKKVVRVCNNSKKQKFHKLIEMLLRF